MNVALSLQLYKQNFGHVKILQKTPSQPSVAPFLCNITGFESCGASYDRKNEELESCNQLRGRKKDQSISKIVTQWSIVPAPGDQDSALEQRRTEPRRMYMT